jgi:hypothetical protein
MQEIVEGLLKAKKIPAIPDWSKTLRPEFMEKARAYVFADSRAFPNRRCG